MSTYKEFFLTKAQLPESILNLVSFLGYSPSNASYATANVLLTVPFGFPDAITTFQIPSGFKFYAGTTEFLTYYATTIRVLNNSSVTVIVTEGVKTYNLPVTVESSQFRFVLPARQLKTTIQEFQVDPDLNTYQFYTLDVTIDGSVSSLIVKTLNPEQLFTEFNSLYLMDQNDYGYISRRTDNGRKLYFGNNLIGKQPTPGSTMEITINETLGSDGNVIAGAIRKGDRIYNTTDSGITEIVNYSLTNAVPATGGDDEESVEEARTNAIAYITSLERLVSENDFQNASIIIDDSPINANSMPVLKRSDVKSEISLFTSLNFNNVLVPTRNLFYNTDPSDTYIPRKTILTLASDEYYTLFDMEIDAVNSVAYYHYVMYEIEQTPTLVRTYDPTYDLNSDLLTVTKSGSQATFSLRYYSTETDYGDCNCVLEVSSTGALYNMANDSTNMNFTYTFSDYTLIPEDEETFYFTISNGGAAISKYSCIFIFRKSLNDFMLSNVVMDDSTACIIYDVPGIEKTYYDGIDQRVFETQIMQELMTTTAFKDYKMLTDFINLKFMNTFGSLENMKYNPITRSSVTNILSIPPTSPHLGDRYIVLNGTGVWRGEDNNIAQCTDETSVTWVFQVPQADDVVYVNNKGDRYTFSDIGWILPRYTIPLEIEVEVFRSSTYAGTITGLASDVRTAIVSTFSSDFGPNFNIYRSEIIDVIQEIDGVSHCRVIKPESSIFFNFNIKNFTQQELLIYAPEFVYFEDDDITVRII